MAPTSRTHRWETVLAGAWKDLGDAALQDALEVAFSSGSDGYQFKARGYTYDVDFGRMKQVNLTTKRERNLRRVHDPHVASVAPVLHTGPSTAPSHPTKATRAGSVVLHPGPAPTPAVAPAAIVAPKTTAPPKTAKIMAPMATAWTRSAKVAPVVSAWSKSVAPAVVAPVATAPVAPPPAPKPTPPAKKPLPHQGKVKTFFKEKGFGFIVLDDNQEVFFHISCVTDFIDDSIRANDTVEVAVAKGAKPRALQVRVKRRGSIFKQMCTNKCCRDKGDRHFEDRCPLKRKRCDRDDASVSTACS